MGLRKGIMLAVPFEEKRLAKWKPPYIVQPKFNGERCRAISLGDSKYMLLSSEENPIFSVPHIIKDLSILGIDNELDGELYCHGMNFEEIHSIVSRTTNLHPDHREIKLHVFDYISEEAQATRICKLTKMIPQNLRWSVVPVPYWICNNLDEVMKAYNKIINKGYEGIIVRHLHAPYLCKHSIWMMKWKPKQTDDYKVISWKEEMSIDGFPKNRLGALTLTSLEGNTFSVGSGFDDESRELLWKERTRLIGRIATINYQHLTAGRKVPRFPVFVSLRKEN